MNNKSLIWVFALIFITSCTVQKRIHNKGFQVEWNKNYLNEKSSIEPDKPSFESLKTESFLKKYERLNTETSTNEIAVINEVDLNKPHYLQFKSNLKTGLKNIIHGKTNYKNHSQTSKKNSTKPINSEKTTNSWENLFTTFCQAIGVLTVFILVISLISSFMKEEAALIIIGIVVLGFVTVICFN